MKKPRTTPASPAKTEDRSPYERDPGAGRADDYRLTEPTPPEEPDAERPPDTLHTETSTGRTTRGEFATDPDTGAGSYRDHTGTFTTDPVDGPEHEEPIDPQIQ